MFIVVINNIDYSCHTLETDAQIQKQLFLDRNYVDVIVEEKETFNPDNTI